MKRTKKDLETVLKSINEMITIPMFNKFNLSKDELIQMKKEIETELNLLQQIQALEETLKILNKESFEPNMSFEMGCKLETTNEVITNLINKHKNK